MLTIKQRQKDLQYLNYDCGRCRSELRAKKQKKHIITIKEILDYQC